MNLAPLIDHTLLDPAATCRDYQTLFAQAREKGFATVCVPPSRVPLAMAEKNLKVCSVVGFPCGYDLSADKLAQASRLVELGVSEVDMVMAVGLFKEKHYQLVGQEIRHIKEVCPRLKVIIESALLNDEEITTAARLCADNGADFVKTSTGFAGGASLRAVELIKKALNGRAKIKASGGIATREQALAFVEAGADRLGTSKSMRVVQQ